MNCPKCNSKMTLLFFSAVCDACNPIEDPSEEDTVVTESSTPYDFEDGRGPVPAKRHLNPGGSIGGWIADTAFVTPEVFMGTGTKVYGSAQVRDRAKLCGQARVYGNAHVYGDSYVDGYAKVFGAACVLGQAQVYGKAEVFGAAKVYDAAIICEQARVHGAAQISGQTRVSGTQDLT